MSSRPEQDETNLRAILEQQRAAHTRQAEANDATRASVERLQRILAIWNWLDPFAEQALRAQLGREPASEERCRSFAEALCSLCKSLKNEGLEGRLDVTPGDDAKTYALAILRRGMDGDVAEVVALLSRAMQASPAFAGGVYTWLRDGLMCEVLHIERAPVLPTGWEGRYLSRVDSVEDFIRWIDNELLLDEKLFSGDRRAASDGRRVRNAYRLVMKLGLTDAPPEPRGTFSHHDELAALRSLRLTCQRTLDRRSNQDAVVRAGAAGDQSDAAHRKGAKQKGQRGRKLDTDPKADKRVADAWTTGQYKTYRECAAALGMPEKKVRAAIDRHRHRTRNSRRRPRAPE
jgi:hypothetical protein